jgi:glycosyltransferase involved in cell wall biosynthesis
MWIFFYEHVYTQMRVWHITRSLYGGAGIYVLRLSEALWDAGIDSNVLFENQVGTDSDDGATAGGLIPNSGSLAQFGTRVVRSMSHRMTSAPFQSLMGADLYGGKKMPQKGDVIHLHGLTGWMGIRGLNALIPEDSPVFWTTHDLWPLSGGCILYSGCDGYQKDCGNCPIMRTGVKSWAKYELKLKEKFIEDKHIQPIANSRWMASHVEHSHVFGGATEVPVIPPIVDPTYFMTEIRDIRDGLQIDPAKKVISLGARAVTDRYKGIPEFLEALARRDELARQCVILLFGEGELELPENLDVRHMGRLDSAEDLAQVYASSDVFVSPSAMETFGMALAEAQACGTPVVAFDVGGVRDAVSEECAEFLVPCGDFVGLLNALSKVFEKSSETAVQWRVSRDWARERFAASVIGSRQATVYEDVFSS